jgi:hypothetical protein
MANPQQPQPLSPYPADMDDEINLADLAKKIWAVRKIWLITLALITLGFFLYWAAQNFTNPVRYTFSKPVQLVFEGANQGQYPNQSTFAVADLVAPAVLHEVYKLNQLNEFGLSEEAFQSGFSVSPYAIDEPFIVAKYASILDNKKASAQEIEAAQQGLKQELQQARSRTALIRYTPVQNAIPANVISKLLDDVAAVWARKAVEERGVLRLDISLHTHRLFDLAQLENLDYPVAILLLRERLQLIEKNIEKILALPNAKNAQDQESGLSLNDVAQRLDEIKTYELDSLESQIQQRFISRNLELTLLYLRERLTKLADQKNELSEKAKVIRAALSDYASRGQSQNATAASSAGGNALVPQVGDKFMDRLVGLVQESSDLQYRQKLNDQATELELQVIESDAEILRLRRQLESFGGEKVATNIELGAKLAEQMRSVFERLREHALIVEQIYARLNTENLGVTGQLYQPLADQAQIQGNRLFIERKFMLAYVLALVLASMLVIPGAMLRNSMRNSAQ